MLSVQLFGVPQLSLDGSPVRISRRKSRALVYYLAAHDGPLTRERVIGVLWPDIPRSAAQQVLRTTVHGLRKELGDALSVANETLALAPDTRVDVRTFESALTTPDADSALLATALARYAGDFLTDAALPDAPEFENWVAAERERYRKLAIRGFIQMSRFHEAARDYAAALASLEQALATDPLQEDLQRSAMRLQYLAGDRPGAIRRFVALRELLDEEMGVPPMAETQALYDAIITDSPSLLQPTDSREPAASGSGRSSSSSRSRGEQSKQQLGELPFVGRVRELQSLRNLIATHRLILIEGESGIGKTRLADEFLAGSGAYALIGRARELEQILPYQPIIEALRCLLTLPAWYHLREEVNRRVPAVWLVEVGRLLPELAPAAARAENAARPVDESRLWEGLNQYLLAISTLCPLVLFIDDIHWADASTLALLGYLVRQPPAAIGFLAAARPIELRSPAAMLLQTLTREERLVRLPLGRLPSGDLAAIAGRLSPRHADPLADWLLRTSEGHPYILNELVRHARQNQLLDGDGAVDFTVLSAAPVVPQSVYSLIKARLDRLSDAARRVLDTAVAAGREFEFDVVARASALSESAALDAFDELHGAGLIRPADDTSYTFDHSQTMEVAYRETAGPRHRLLHRRVAEALESVHPDRIDSLAGLLAWHYREGRAPSLAAPHALRAGQQAAALGGWKEAAAFFQQALEGAEGEQRLTVLLELGRVRHQAGEVAAAAEAYRDALGLALGSGDLEHADAARMGLARAYLQQARFSDIVTLARDILAVGRPQSAIGAEFIWGTALSLEGADLASAAEHLNRAATICTAPADRLMFAQIKFELGSVAAQQGDLVSAIALYREALAAAGDADSDEAAERRILAHNNLAYHLLLLGDPTAAEHARIGMAEAQERGVLGLQPYFYSTMGEIALAAGDLDEAERNFSRGLALAERLSMPERIAGLTANLGLVAARRGNSQLAIHRLSSALASADALGTRHLAAQIRLWLAPLLPAAEARTRLAEARAIAESGGRRRLLAELATLEASLTLG